MPKPLAILLIEGLADWEPGLAIASLREYYKYETVALGVGGTAPITTLGGLKVTPDAAVAGAKAEDYSLILLPGSDVWWQQPEQPQVSRLVQAAERAKVPVAGICAGTVALARAGLLNDRRHTSNALDWLKQVAGPDYRGEAHYVDQPAVTDRGVVTAPGVAPLRFAYEIIHLLDVPNVAEFDRFYAQFKAAV